MSRARLSLVSASLLIAACGSGGDSFTEAQSTTTTFNITSADAVVAASLSWEAAMASGDFADLGGALGLSSAMPGGFEIATVALPPTGSLINIVQQVPFGPDVYPCLSLGTVSVSGDVENPLTLTPGDTFRVVYELCDDGLGEVVNGMVDFTVRDFAGEILAGTYLLSMDAVVTDLQIQTGTDTITSNGDATVNLDTESAPAVAASVSGASMTTDRNTSSETVTNYFSSQTVDAGVVPAPYTMSAAGTLDSTQLGGIVRYSTVETFQGFDADYPDSGVLLVEGETSSARLIAVDNVNVTIELDSNGDGVTDETFSLTWVELTS